MKLLSLLSTAVAMALALDSFGSAAIIGVFSDLGIVNGAKVYSFDLTSDEDIFGLDFSRATGGGFEGKFNNQGLSVNATHIPDTPRSFIPVFPQPGLLTETYFTFSPIGLITIGVEDGALQSDFLGAAFVLVGGGILVPANELTTVAVFSTTDGAVPTFLGGFGATASGDVPITLVPEPTTLLLAGLSLLAFAGRRRS